MNNDIIIQTMTESFEALKDSWDTKKESIIKCIVETEVYDGSLAMDMWAYVLGKNADTHNTKEANFMFVDDIILSFNKKYYAFPTPEDLCRNIMSHIAPHIVKNENLIKLIFGSMYNAGYTGKSYWLEGRPLEPLPACMACMFYQDYPQFVPILLKSLSSNKHMEDIRVGELILKANYYLDEMCNRLGYNYKVSDQVKENLYSCLDMIKDKNDRAEIALSLMAR